MAKKRKAKDIGTEAPAMDKDWRADSDLRTIEEAHEIIGDSTRFAAAKRKAKAKMESLARIKRLTGKAI